mgnify:CR=1 FL=1
MGQITRFAFFIAMVDYASTTSFWFQRIWTPHITDTVSSCHKLTNPISLTLVLPNNRHLINSLRIYTDEVKYPRISYSR